MSTLLSQIRYDSGGLPWERPAILREGETLNLHWRAPVDARGRYMIVARTAYGEGRAILAEHDLAPAAPMTAMAGTMAAATQRALEWARDLTALTWPG